MRKENDPASFFSGLEAKVIRFFFLLLVAFTVSEVIVSLILVFYLTFTNPDVPFWIWWVLWLLGQSQIALVWFTIWLKRQVDRMKSKQLGLVLLAEAIFFALAYLLLHR